MPGWAWALLAVGAVILLALLTWQLLRQRRTRTLQERFGPEYDRTLETADDRREAEADLAARAKRRDELEIRPLTSAARERYLVQWERVQARFVDDPEGAVREGDMVVQSVMSERGYPMDDFEQRAADVSVDHPRVVENYRKGHRLTRQNALGDGTTEDLRQAMVHYRALFEDLLEVDQEAPRVEGATSARG